MRILTILLALFAGYVVISGWPTWDFWVKKGAALQKNERQLTFWHGDEFLENCAPADANGDDDAKARYAFCFAYVVGVADSFEMVSQGLTNVCRSGSDSADQLYSVAMEWIKAHPMEVRRPAAKLIALAFEETWPCAAERVASEK